MWGGGEGEEGDLWGGGGDEVVGEGWVEGGGNGEREEGKEEGEGVKHRCGGGWGRELVMGRPWGEEWLTGRMVERLQGLCGGLYKMGFCAGIRSCGGGWAGIGLLVVRSYGWRRAKW